MMKIEKGNTKVCLCQETLAVTVEKGQTRWEWTEGFQPELICKEGSFHFLDAKPSPMKPIRWAWEPESGAASKDLKKTA